MKVQPKKIKFTLHQSRYIEIEISAENGYEMPDTLERCIEYHNDIQFNPEQFVEQEKQYINCNWVVDENDVQDLEWLSEEEC